MSKHYLNFALMKTTRISCIFTRKLNQSTFEKEVPVETNASIPGKKKGKRTNSSATFCSPPLDVNQCKELSSIVAINLRIDTVSWARICRNGNQLTNWNIHSLPPDIMKLDPIRVHQVAQSIYKNLPQADVYVMDQLKTRVGSKNPAASTVFLTKLQLLSMLISMINHPHSNSDRSAGEGENTIYRSKVVLLRPHLVMKLFNLLVGEELVSVGSTVDKVIKNEPCKTHFPLKIELDALLDYKLTKNIVDRESMGVALLMSITFMELLIYKNPDSLKILLKNF